jgi:two-component system nitrate/nitrite response regulator NarL
MPIRVLLVNSQPIVLWGLEKLINDESPQMQVVGKATNGPDALQLAREQKPHILLLDLYLGREKSLDSISDLLKKGEGHFHIIILTEIRDPTVIDGAVRIGARGVIYKDEPTQNILKAIKKVHAGELWLDRGATGRIFMSFLGESQKPANAIERKIRTLTAKERAIVSAFAEEGGASNKRIARKLCIHEQTLRNHLTSIFSKLGITNRFDLFMFAKLHQQEIDLPNTPSASSKSGL